MSYIAWLDHSEHKRRKMLDIIDLFREQETVDELGVGSIRDAFAEVLFPGTSTIQTRARYFLFIPWAYTQLERKGIGSRDIAAKARWEEVALIEALAASGEREGVIGIEARQKLKRLPSAVYWNGLASWGIRRFTGPQDEYHRSLDRFHVATAQTGRTDDGEPIEGGLQRNWDAGLPPPPARFPKGATLTLEREEAEYLAERLLSSHPNTLLAVLASGEHAWERCNFPWDHPRLSSFTARHRLQLEHAQRFSEGIHGAPLLYNLMLAEKSERKDRIQEYQDRLEEWAGRLAAQAGAFAAWDREELWRVAAQAGPRVGPQARAFVSQWLSLALPPERAKAIRRSSAARGLVAHRERALKGEQSRLTNQRALERWSGAAGVGQIDFRWRVAQTILLEILAGRGKRG